MNTTSLNVTLSILEAQEGMYLTQKNAPLPEGEHTRIFLKTAILGVNDDIDNWKEVPEKLEWEKQFVSLENTVGDGTNDYDVY